MKYFLHFVLILIFMLVSGCKNKTQDYDIEHIADLIIEEINLPKETSENLNFKSQYQIEDLIIEVDWIPSDETIISVGGIINKGMSTREVNIEIIIQINDDQTTRNLGKIKILPLTDVEILQILKSKIDIPDEINDYIEFPHTAEIAGSLVSLQWHSSNPGAVTDNGIVNIKEFDQYSNLQVTVITENNENQLNWGEVKIPGRSKQEHIDFVINKINIPETIDCDINLPSQLYGVNIKWYSSNPNAVSINDITKQAIWHFNNTDQEVTLTAWLYYDGVFKEKSYQTTVLTIPFEERIQIAFDTIRFPETVNSHLSLPTEFAYEVNGEWLSSNPDILDTDGNVVLTNEEHIINLTLILYSGDLIMNKEYQITIEKLNENEVFIQNHFFIDRAEIINLGNNPDLTKNNNKIILMPHATSGTYESPIYRTNNFNSLVGSWAAISHTKATAELQIRVRVNNVWSQYFTYSPWGLGRNNAMIKGQQDSIAEMAFDEIKINDDQVAQAFQYMITLRRNTVNEASPVLSLVAAALEMPDYSYPVDVFDLPKKIDYPVPQLYQKIVPEIGGKICSPTSSTMLLMYMGHQFEGDMPHHEIASLFYDHGNNIYGNWVYNTVGMSAYGENSYVKRIYSWEELQHHLATVGPVALSISGNTGIYTTNGHLLVVRGYEITEQGTKVICNDPNLETVRHEYDLSVFLNFTRNVIYVIEPQ